MSLGGCWETRLCLCQRASNLLRNIVFTPSVTSLRNAGVRCSSHLGGTSPSAGKISDLKRNCLSLGRPFGSGLGALGSNRSATHAIPLTSFGC